MQILWSNFAKTLNANDDGNGANLVNVWPEYTNEYGMDNLLDIVDYEKFIKRSTDNDTAAICTFWNKVGYAGQYSDPTPTNAPTESPTETLIAESTEYTPDSIDVGDDAIIHKPFIFMCIILGMLCFS
mmetsp:Transcript_26307/g.23095  ORF Transcript_26307/g.23095 Transcript_26307/m.23095 type:complete len:128 (-) Transcript_26307:112-495(-)